MNYLAIARDDDAALVLRHRRWPSLATALVLFGLAAWCAFAANVAGIILLAFLGACAVYDALLTYVLTLDSANRTLTIDEGRWPGPPARRIHPTGDAEAIHVVTIPPSTFRGATPSWRVQLAVAHEKPIDISTLSREGRAWQRATRLARRIGVPANDPQAMPCSDPIDDLMRAPRGVTVKHTDGWRIAVRDLHFVWWGYVAGVAALALFFAAFTDELTPWMLVASVLLGAICLGTLDEQPAVDVRGDAVRLGFVVFGVFVPLHRLAKREIDSVAIVPMAVRPRDRRELLVRGGGVAWRAGGRLPPGALEWFGNAVAQVVRH